MIPFLSKRDIVLRMSKAWLMMLCMIPAFAASWTNFEDPNEKAFTLEIPQGWTVQGGMFRLGYSDYRPMVDLKSPDGKISIRLGDARIPSYAAPSPNHTQEGAVYDLGAQAQMVVAKYRTGQDYALLYSKVRFKDCKALTPETVTTPPPASAPPELPEVKEATTGQVAYSCDGSRTAYVFSKTANYGGIWQVHALWSFEAPTDQVLSARAIIEHAMKTYKLSDAWIAYQKKLDQEALVYQRERQHAKMRQLSQQVAQFEMKMAAERRQFESMSHTLNGELDTVDPIGNHHLVSIGPKDGYWTDGLGHYVNSPNSPGPGWQQLTPTGK